MFGKRADEAEAGRIISAALDAGVNFLDTAAMYGEGAAEELLGRILKPVRRKVFLATKVNGIDAEAITRSIEESLRRLQTDFVDLYLIHWPKKGMKPMEVMQALNDVVKSGKARFVGCCNYPAWLFCYSNAISRLHGWPELVCNQVPYNPIERGVEVEVLPQALAEGTAITVYRTLLIGLLAGKYQPGRPIPEDSRGETDERIADWLERYTSGMRHLLDLAAQRKVSPVHVAIAWVASCPAVTCPIVGASRLDQLEDSLQAFDFELTAEERDGISRAFGAEVKEESGGAYAELRRELHLTS
jgi:aryl-alcohol dehydrogenase-like predicted oxidoreductase